MQSNQDVEFLNLKHGVRKVTGRLQPFKDEAQTALFKDPDRTAQ